MSYIRMVVDQRGSQLRLQNRVIILESADGHQQRVGLATVKQILIHGECQISSGLLRACHAEQIDVLCISNRGTQGTLSLLPQKSRRVQLRLAQFNCYRNQSSRLHLARYFLTEKLSAQAKGCPKIEATLPDLLNSLQSAETIPTMMGIEGAAASGYFAHYRQKFDQSWQFTERNRRPPRDPINALLSFSYAIAGADVARELTKHGLDLYLGYLHSPQNGRHSLALDVLEVLRPTLDNWIEDLIISHALTPDNFTYSKQDGCRLDKTGRGIFFTHWIDAEQAMRSPLRKAIAYLLRYLRRQDLAESSTHLLHDPHHR